MHDATLACLYVDVLTNDTALLKVTAARQPAVVVMSLIQQASLMVSKLSRAHGCLQQTDVMLQHNSPCPQKSAVLCPAGHSCHRLI